MNIKASFFLLLFGVFGCHGPTPSASQERVQVVPSFDSGGKISDYEVHFSPHGGCTDMIVRYINGAKHSVLVQAYSFTSKPIGAALIEAHFRLPEMALVLDRSNLKGHSLIPIMKENNVPIWIDDKHAIAHNKIVLIDDDIVITGSFNLSKAAEDSNAENCIALRSVHLAAKYKQNWILHRDHSVLH